MSIASLKQRLLNSSLFKDSAWALIGNVLGKGLALLASILVARFLGKELYGMYGMIRTTLLTIAIFSTFGLGYTGTKYIAEYMDKAQGRIKALIASMMRITLFVSTLFAALLFIFSHEVAAYLNAPQLYASFRYLAVIIIFNSITTTQIGILSGFKKFKPLARINLMNGIVTFVLSVVLTYYYGLEGALWALLVSQAYNCLQNYMEVRRNTRRLGEQEKVEHVVRTLVSFSLPITLREMIMSASQLIFPILLTRFSTYGELGLYNAVALWSSVILFIPGALINVMLSHLSSAVNDRQRQKDLMKRMIGINFTSTLIMVCIVCLAAPLITHFYGESFSSLTLILRVAVSATIFHAVSNVFFQFFWSTNRAWLTVVIQFFTPIVSVGLYFLLKEYTKESGALTISIANVCTAILVFLSLLFCYFKKLKINSTDK